MMSRQSVSNIVFYVTTMMLILVIVLCVGQTVKSESRGETQQIENKVQEQQLLTQMRQYLDENGYRNSGVTLTYVTDQDGACDYTFTIHHKKIDAMSEEERECFTLELQQACRITGEGTASYEYLFTD